MSTEKQKNNIDDKNAPLLWCMLTQAKELALESCREEGYHNSMIGNLYVDKYVVGYIGALLGFLKTQSHKDASSMVHRIEERLKSYRREMLFKLPLWNSCYQTDGEVIFPSDDSWEQKTDWNKLNEILAREKEMGIYLDLTDEEELPFDAGTGDIQTYVQKKQRDTTMQITRQMILHGHLSYPNEIVNCIGITGEEAEILVREGKIRKKINQDLNEIYICKAIYGLARFIKNAASEEKIPKEWISYIAGMSMKQTTAWIEEPEKQMIIEACRHWLGKTTIAKRLKIPKETVELFYLDPRAYENRETLMNENSVLSDIHMPDEYREAMYKKYVNL